MTKKHAIHHMTWKEVDDVFKMDPVILVPLGSMEEHGPHSLTGDFMAATEVAKKVAEESDSFYIPTIPFGNSEYFRGFPGTVSLSGNTVSSILLEIVESLTEHGIKRIVFINGHAGNEPNIDQVCRKVSREKGLYITSINLWQSLSDEFKKELYQEDYDPSGHGGEPLSSVMTYLFPEDIRMDLLKDITAKEKWQGATITSLTRVNANGTNASLYLNMDDATEEGVMGNPRGASEKRGEAILKEVVKKGVNLVAWVKSIETEVK